MILLTFILNKYLFVPFDNINKAQKKLLWFIVLFKLIVKLRLKISQITIPK